MAIHVITSLGAISRKNAKRYLSEHLTIPETVTKIEEEAFFRQPKIQSVSFSNALESIGARAFQDCIHLTKLHLPDSLQRIETEAFSGCKALVEVAFPATMKNISDRCFYRCRGLEKIIIPEGIQRIGVEAFYFASISELELPSTLLTIKDKAFFRCNRLTNVVIPKNVTHIGMEAFHGCNYLKTLEIAHDPDFIGVKIVNRSTTIRCYKGSKVDDYCKKFEIPTEYIVDNGL